MAQYIEVEGKLKGELDSGALVDMVGVLAVEGGLPVSLPSGVITQLRSPILPPDYPLPSSQVAALQSCTVVNFPTGFNVNNLPLEFPVGNFPANYPLPPTQETMLQSIQTALATTARGSGPVTTHTLRFVPALNRVTGTTRTSVSASLTPQVLASGSETRQSLSIYNNSAFVLYVGYGNSFAPSPTDFSFKLFSNDFYPIPHDIVGLEFRGVWEGTVGSAMVTQGA